MNAWPSINIQLLAQIDRLQQGLRNRFSGPRAKFGTEDAITAIGAIVAVAIVLYFVNRWHNRHSGRHSYNNPQAMFGELCKAHNLDRKTAQLLKRVASWQRLEQPARLFLEPERFEPANLSPELERYSAELLELRSKLFIFEVTAASQDSARHPRVEVSPKQTAAGHAAGLGPVAMPTTMLEQPIRNVESTAPAESLVVKQQ